MNTRIITRIYLLKRWLCRLQNAGIISRNDSFHLRKSEIDRGRIPRAAQFGEWVRAIFLIPVSPRVILATFERRKCRQRFCIRPLLQFIRACARAKGIPAGKVCICTTVRSNPLLRGRFCLVSLSFFLFSPFFLPFFTARTFFPALCRRFSSQFRRRDGKNRKRIYNTQCSLSYSVSGCKYYAKSYQTL